MNMSKDMYFGLRALDCNEQLGASHVRFVRRWLVKDSERRSMRNQYIESLRNLVPVFL